MSRHVTFMTIDDAEHYTPEQRAEIIAAFSDIVFEVVVRRFKPDPDE
ncbi:hypothetical protein RFN29_11805 [Mesorhizobium sp. VK22B]|uniref:Uncharacterized protein n=1 Tax=Mesorhizobium captivum TaxID=3072319 RepID=A0ABU4YZ63_9HYPH|nr:hypothetical protein [Mesorhizobium sp. VK22B]MDX8492266.1 hypothetical protein [Mesorhizobium sp. VK22B]